MDNIVNISLENLSKAVEKVLDKLIETGEISEADKLILILYQNEKSKATAVPTYKKVINCVKEIIATFKDVLPQNNESLTINENEPIAAQSVEVNTDEL